MSRAFQYPYDVPVLDDGEVTLRAVTSADIPAVLEMCADEAVQQWTQVPVPYVRADAEEFLADVQRGWGGGRTCCWGIEVAGGYAGTIDLRYTGTAEAEVGFILHPAYRGKGTMRRALDLVATYAFDVGGVRSLLWTAGAGNWPSRRTAWACGFTFRGTLPDAWGNGRGHRSGRWLATLQPDSPRKPVGPWLVAPALTGPSVTLRGLREDDAGRIVEACREQRTRHWLAGLPDDYDEAEALRHVEDVRQRQSEGRWITWGIADPTTDHLLGEVSLMGADLAGGTEGELGYWAHPDARGRGVMSEAVGLVVRWAFATESGLALERICLRAAAPNTASRHVAERAGFRLVGLQRRAESLRDGTVEDLAEYDVIAADLPTGNSADMTDNQTPERSFGWSDMWAPPEDDPRAEGGFTGERDTLLGYLRDQRLTLQLKCSGLDAADLARRSVPPSNLSLLGLVRHLSAVEQSWFRLRLAGEPGPRHFLSADGVYDDFDGALGDPAVVEAAWALWRDEVAFGEAYVAGIEDLGTLGASGDAVRDVLVHLIEEYARHNGHADFLRERIDGRVGQ